VIRLSYSEEMSEVPSWLPRMREKLMELADLRPGWSYKSDPPEAAAVKAAWRFCLVLADASFGDRLKAAPMADGGVSIRIDTRESVCFHNDLEIVGGRSGSFWVTVSPEGAAYRIRQYWEGYFAGLKAGHARGAKEERKACAEIALNECVASCSTVASDIAEAIRARSNPKG
jgi:hypothetical protein